MKDESQPQDFETILDHPLCATCVLCCLPWNHHPSKGVSLRERAAREAASKPPSPHGEDFDYPCGWLTPAGCALAANERPAACREFSCKRLRATANGEAYVLPMGRDEEWLLALFDALVCTGKAREPKWLAPVMDENRKRRAKRLFAIAAETTGDTRRTH